MVKSVSHSPRRLSRAHFAFARAVAQGVDERESWVRYMALEGEHTDVRTVRKTVQWMREEFAAAAARCNKPGTARLVRMDPELLADTAQLPTVDEFAASEGWEDFSHEELLVAYADRFGVSTQKRSPRARVIAKQLEALAWLERLVAVEPGSGDEVAAWFAPPLARMLQGSGLPTLFTLAERINGMGQGWYRGIRGIGAGKALRIAEWMKSNQMVTGLAIGAHAFARRTSLTASSLATVVPAATELRPLEKFIIPSALDGSQGKYRGPAEHCLLLASNGKEAVETWLASKRQGANGPWSPTQRAYRKEAERLILWAVLERGKALSSLSVEDAFAYMAFLEQPAAAWCGPRHHQRWSPLWRPFEGPLKPAAAAQALTILRSLYAWLNQQVYLVGNPFAAVPRPRTPVKPIGWGRTLTQEQMKYVLQYLKGLPESEPNRRLKLAVPWLYFCGLRLQEMVNARCGHLQGVNADGWLLDVVGKGGKFRTLPVPAQLVGQLSRCMVDLGMPSDPMNPEVATVPILWRVEDAKTLELLPLTSGRLYKDLRRFFTSCADALTETDAGSAARLRQASTHWLRHSHASHLVNGGEGRVPVPVHIARENLGHSSLDTTTGYISTERNLRMAAMKDFFALVGNT